MRSALLLLLLVSAPALADTYAIDVKGSEVVVKTWKEGFAAGLAHNHIIQATDFSGELTFDPAAPDATAVTMTVQVASLIPDDPMLRKKFGEKVELKPEDRKKVTENMLAPGQLDAAKFPSIRFVSSSMTKDKKGGWVLSGQLTLHGVTKPVEVPVTIALKDGQAVGDARLRFKTSSYGIKPYSAGLGSVRNRDEVELSLHLVGVTSSHP